MSVSPDEPTVLIVDPLPLRNLGLVALLDRLAGATKFRLASLTPDEAEKWIEVDAGCSMIIYNVGGASVADHKHLKRIKGLRARAADAPLVILSDNDDRKEILAALSVGAQGFLYTGTNAQLALQALSFIFVGGSYFPSAVQPKRRPAAHVTGEMECSSPPAQCALDEGHGAAENGAVEDAGGTGSVDFILTERQKAVLEHLSRGDSNKLIARQLGIRDGTVKVHVRHIMRKLGVANRTQVAIACTNGAGADMRADERGVKDKIDLASDHGRFRLSVAAR
jgi:DNA-binding NarL/FixJ family response regulator